eukprot:jgi/Chlat1/8738/Chrsp9S08566
MSWKRPAAHRGQLYDAESIQVMVDPMERDLDDDIAHLAGQVSALKQVTREIETETKHQKQFIEELEATMAKAQLLLKGAVKKVNRAFTQGSSNHMLFLMLFALACFALVYIMTKLR